MRPYQLGPNHDLSTSVISLGCMRIGKLEDLALDALLASALESGINFFDHADIYGSGRCEEVFAAALKRNRIPRESIILQSKCGIRKGQFDFSEKHILGSTDAILQRLGTDYIDILMLHRPDTLMEPEEIARAFDQLQASGKVRHFAVSNMNPGQIELLRRSVKQPLVANQIQLSLAHTGIIDAGINVNMCDDPAVVRDGGVLEYCRLHDIAIQAWSPFQYGFFEGVFIGSEKFPALNELLNQFGEAKNLTPTAVSIAWLLRHPARIQPVIGTTNPQRVREIALAADAEMTREEWYQLYLAAGNRLP